MAIVQQHPKIDLQVTIQMNESEARALDALLGYNMDEFLKVFYETMGRAYLEPHEAGIRSLERSLRSEMVSILNRLDAARKAFNSRA